MISRKQGFALLETLIAFLIATLFIILSYQAIVLNSTRQHRALQEYWQSEMGRAVLEEYVGSYPYAEKSGIFQDHWVWTITEVSVQPLVASTFDRQIEYSEIMVSVWPTNAPTDVDRYSTVVGFTAAP